MKLDFHHGIVNYLTSNGWLDHWTATHMAAGAFICKVAQWCGASDMTAVIWVFGIGLAWEFVEWIVEGWKPYGSKEKWFNNTISDLAVETGLAIWMVI